MQGGFTALMIASRKGFVEVHLLALFFYLCLHTLSLHGSGGGCGGVLRMCVPDMCAYVYVDMV